MQYNPTKRFMKISLATLLLSMGHSFCANATVSPTPTSSSTTTAKLVTTTTSVATPETQANTACVQIFAAKNALNDVLPELEKLQNKPGGALAPKQVELIYGMPAIRVQIQVSLASLDSILKTLHCS